VARFPWDPKPEPPPPAPAPLAQQQTASQNNTTQAHFSPTISLPNAAGAGTAAAGQNGVNVESAYIKQEAGIKQEPGVATGAPALPNYNGMDNTNNLAASRAAQQLQLQYGIRAAGSINAIQGQQQPQQQQQQGQGQAPATGSSSISNGQTDGPGDGDEDEDYEGILMQRNAEGTLNELGRVEIDRMLHSQIAARAKSMEGGGLMLPLKEATRHTVPSKNLSRKGKGIAGYDGGDDDDDIDDEDAINSDLDDPEDEHDEDEVDDEGLGHIMLCMYDKVQRVKNKWYVFFFPLCFSLPFLTRLAPFHQST
jgi:transcription initiation factor TFIIA large subunit